MLADPSAAFTKVGVLNGAVQGLGVLNGAVHGRGVDVLNICCPCAFLT